MTQKAEPSVIEQQMAQVVQAQAEQAMMIGDLGKALEAVLNENDVQKAKVARLEQMVLRLVDAVTQIGGVVQEMAVLRHA